jgi:hypothetical protein
MQEPLHNCRGSETALPVFYTIRAATVMERTNAQVFSTSFGLLLRFRQS